MFGRRRARERHPSSGSSADLARLWEDEPSDAAGQAPPDAAATDAMRAPPPGPPPTPPLATPPAAGAGPITGLDSPPPASPRRPPSGRGRRQLAGVAVVVAALAAAVVVDRAIGSGESTAVASPTPTGPTMAESAATSSAWYCPALAASVTSRAAGSLIIANTAGAAVSVVVTAVPSSGRPVVTDRVMAPYTRAAVRLQDIAPGNYTAATVVFEGSGGAVEEEVHGSLGDSIAPCASGSSNHWYFATGSTDDNATEYISLYNPYPAPAIADLSFETDQGPFNPDAFQAIVVPGGGFNVVDIGTRVRSRTKVSTTVDVRSGRLVATELQELTNLSRSGPRGLALTLGAPDLGSSWYFADGRVNSGVTERFDVFNPGDAEAAVSAAPILDQGSADPFDLTVPPQATVSLEVDQQARIPPGIGEAWVLTSTNGVPVAVERVIVSRPPTPTRGVADATGVPAPARRWVFAAGTAAQGADERVVVFDPGGAPARVSVVASGSGQAVTLRSLVVGAGARAAVDIGELDRGATVVIELTSNVPVVAEREQVPAGGAGLSNATGIAGQ